MTRQQIEALMNEEIQVVMLELKVRSDEFMNKLKKQSSLDRMKT